MKSACIIIPVHNRRETSLLCLQRLWDQEVMEWADVVLVDDGSTDGTREAVELDYPEVIVLSGDGNLWWAGGINAGMRYCRESGYAFFFWLNDDCRPAPGTLEHMIEYCEQTGNVCSALSVTPSGYSYGGFVKTAFSLKRITVGPCDTFGGNCVCFPSSVIGRVGYLDDRHFPMDPADADYGLRLTRLGGRACALEGAVCENDDNLTQGKQSWLFSRVPGRVYLYNFFRNRYHTSFIPTQFRYRCRHWGVRGFIHSVWFYLRFFLYMTVRFAAPKGFLRRFSSHSASWKKQAHYEA